MGQKVNPIGLRLGINRTWDSRWYAGKSEYGKLLHEDMKIRDDLMKALKQAAVSKVVIERPHKKCRVTIHSARPGVVIGKKGADIEKLRKSVAELTECDVVINIVEIRKPEIDAQLGRRIDRPAARAPRRVPPRHEARGAVGDAAWRGGHPHQLLGPSRRRRNRAHGVVPRGPRAAAHAARRRRLRRRHRVHHLWHLRRQGLDLQGRDHGARLRWRRTSGWPRPRPAGRRRDAAEAHEKEREEVSSCCNRRAPSSARRTRAASTALARAATISTSAQYGLKAMEPERITARQIEAARRALTRHMKRAGPRVDPRLPGRAGVEEAAEVRMGSGKGAPEFWVCRVKPGRILFEVDGVSRELAARGARRWPPRSCRSRPVSSRGSRPKRGQCHESRRCRVP